MKIPYIVKTSKFLDPCKSAVIECEAELKAGLPVTIKFISKSKYNGEYIVSISHSEKYSFETNYESSDPSRFPQRIKAAATALLKCGYEGAYRISHFDNVLTIRLSD